ncbi:MAG TPA: tRNA (adenosine(37)-N6)-threonylcarbamoyltransferase complex dimerization subunit type 1 TsaB [Nitrospira sp.]
MKVLAVDTATAWQSVALLDDQTVLARHDQQTSASHSALLLPTIDRLFAETGTALKQLDGLIVSIGPGSFTGLRVGLATMLGFRTVTGLPLAVVPTLEGMAWNLRGAALPVCPVLNSRRGELYWAVFRWTADDQLERVLAEQVGTPERLGSILTGNTILFGEGWAAESDAIRSAISSPATVVETPAHVWRPSAVSVGFAGLARLRRGEQAGMGISPLYVQRAEAELQYEQSGGLSPLARRQAKISRKLGRHPALGGRAKRHHK